MRRPAWSGACLLAWTLVAGSPAPVGSETPRAERAPVSRWVHERLEQAAEVEILIVLDSRDEVWKRIDGGMPRAIPRRALVAGLRSRAETSQRDLLADLEARGIAHRRFWVVDAIWARVDARDLEWLRQRPEVTTIVGNPEVPLALPRREDPGPRGPRSLVAASTDVEPGVAHAGAPTFWDAGFFGEGVTIGIADTGVDWDHPALKSAYRGWNGTSASHDYNWHDAVHSGTSSCGVDLTAPCDDYDPLGPVIGHGTHVTGTAIGDDLGEPQPGTRNRIGMAPGARWIACRNMLEGNGTPARYLECFEWFLSPTNLDGENPDPDLAPDVVNNSWYCSEGEGCTDSTPVLEEAVENLTAAGILVVSAAGNDGSACGTIQFPPGIYDASLTVGATNTSDVVASFSSRGDGAAGQPVKPDLAAVGVGVRSSIVGGGYESSNGTSMAAPHVAGAAALLLSACPGLDLHPGSIAAYLRNTTLPRTGATCGTVPGSERPNTTYGWGALRMVLPEAGGCPLFRDGFESGNTDAWR